MMCRYFKYDRGDFRKISSEWSEVECSEIVSSGTSAASGAVVRFRATKRGLERPDLENRSVICEYEYYPVPSC